MFQNLVSRITEDDNPRLHRIPFMVIWIAAYGLSWFSGFFVTMLFSDLFDTYLFNNNPWFIGTSLGLAFGLMLALVQGWILRRRYGFVPKFWRVATIIGATIGTIIFFMVTDTYWEGWELWFAGTAWFGIIALCQSAVLFRVNRQSWMLALTGILAGVVASSIEASQIANYNSIIWAILVGSAIQAIGTGLVMLRLMANPREGIIPKRDSDEKAKARIREGLHPFTFIAFWGAAYLMGWVMLLLVFVLWFLTVGETDFVQNIIYFMEEHMEWSFGVIMGGIIGFVSALAQPWLMKQHSKTQVRHWIITSTVGWALAGIGLYYYMDNYYLNNTERLVSLGVWFIVPALFQTIPMWRAMRGGWMWLATGVVTAIVAILIETQFDWTYNAEFYAMMIGGIAQAIITGTVFILLKSQQVQVEQSEQAEVVTA